MKRKPNMSFWQIWNMSFGFLGIQFGFALQNANVSRIFETLNANIEKIPLLWIAAPVTGLIVQPIIGHLSDRTWTRLGRRRPYFLTGAIIASIALLIMPNSPVLWVAAGMLWIMDASINVSMEPFRAFVGDNLPSKQRTKGFAMQSFFIGIGAVVASALPYILTNWFNVANTAPDGEIPPSVKWSFYIGAFVFISAVLWTVIFSKEYSPKELEEFESASRGNNQNENTIEHGKAVKKSYFLGTLFLLLGAISSIMLYFGNVNKEVYIFSGGLLLFGVLELFSGILQAKKNSSNGFVTIFNDLNHLPKTMGQLAIVQFFSWFALFAMWIYTTAGVTAHIYGTSDTKSLLYNEGANWVGICFAVYNGFAAVFAFLLIYMAKITSRKITHTISLLIGGISFISIYFVKDPQMLLISFIGIGLAWSSILAMPYAILAGSLPAKKMGVYMGIFNFFIVIPQILAASILGFLVQSIFDGQAIYALILGGASMILASILVLFVKDKDE